MNNDSTKKDRGIPAPELVTMAGLMAFAESALHVPKKHFRPRGVYETDQHKKFRSDRKKKRKAIQASRRRNRK